MTGVNAQTRGGDGGTAQRIRPGLPDKELNEARARQGASNFAEQSRYKGTQVKPDPKATGEALALQTRIASLLSAEDFVPEQRKAHFRQMSENKHTPITGWYGTVLGLDGSPK